MTKIVQFGCFGTRNYGDEMGAIAVRKMTKKVYPDAEISMLGYRADLIAKNHKDLFSYAVLDDTRRIRNLIQDADLWIIGPGTIFGTALMPIADRLRAFKKPYMLWGVSAAEPFREKEATYDVIRGAAFVGVRDNYTKNLLASKGLSSEVVADSLIGNVEGIEKIHRAVTISWGAMQLPPQTRHEVNCALAGFMEWKRWGQWIGLPSSWNAVDPFDNDFIPLGELSQLYLLNAVIPQDFQEVSEYLSQTKLLLTSRLHLGIVAMAAGARVVFFGQPKCQRWLETVGMAEAYAGDYGDVSIKSLRSAYHCSRKETIASRLRQMAGKSGELFDKELRRAVV